jgi:hypothetical protein
MTGNGKHPAEIIIPGKDGDNVEKFDGSGRRVIAAEIRSASGTTLLELMALPVEPFKVDPTLLKMPERPAIPTFTDDGPPKVYDYSERAAL